MHLQYLETGFSANVRAGTSINHPNFWPIQLFESAVVIRSSRALRNRVQYLNDLK